MFTFSDGILTSLVEYCGGTRPSPVPSVVGFCALVLLKGGGCSLPMIFVDETRLPPLMFNDGFGISRLLIGDGFLSPSYIFVKFQISPFVNLCDQIVFSFSATETFNYPFQ